MARKKRTWIVMADSACARILATNGADDAFHAVDGGYFENPSARLHTRELGTDRPARVREIGLSISSSIVEAHGGKLWYEPGAGGGATFKFTLPAEAPVEAKA